MSMRNQVTFKAEADCQEFQPNRLKPNICINCYKQILAHASEAVIEDKMIQAALEYSQVGVASLILESYPIGEPKNDAGLYLGGFKSAINLKFLQKHNIKYIVNTAGGLEMFGPKYIGGKQKVKDAGVDFLELGWVDNMEQQLEASVLANAIRYIDSALRVEKASVLVHCAQGKSRSTSVVVAFLMASSFDESMNFDTALKFVQENRLMAEPNKNFETQLKVWHKSPDFQAIRNEICKT